MEPNQNSNGMLNGLPLTPKDNRKIGPIVGVLVIVLVIIVGALYFFSQRLNTTDTNTTETTADMQESTTDDTTNSNGASALEADLDSQLLDIDYSF